MLDYEVFMTQSLRSFEKTGCRRFRRGGRYRHVPLDQASSLSSLGGSTISSSFLFFFYSLFSSFFILPLPLLLFLILLLHLLHFLLLLLFPLPLFLFLLPFPETGCKTIVICFHVVEGKRGCWFKLL